MKDSLFIKAAFSQKTERPPVWMMRQAGRFMPEYWEIKNKYSFLEMCKTPELAADVTMLPVDLLGIDAAILIFGYIGYRRGHGRRPELYPGCWP
jgi:uroporphyrinogen decarboxylase